MTDWRKSSHCSLGDCCWVRPERGGVAITRRVPHHLDAAPTTPPLWFSLPEFEAFVLGAKAGEFDYLFAPPVAESVQDDTERPDPPEPAERRCTTDLRPNAGPSRSTASPEEETR